ncbi:MAG: glutamate ligase domain-containing protein [Spirochaetaceae bacterium]
MTTLQLLIMGGAGLVAFFIIVIGVIGARAENNLIEERLGRGSAGEDYRAMLDLDEEDDLQEPVAKNRALDALNNVLEDRSFGKKWRVQLARANLKLTVGEFAVLHVLAMMGAFVAGYFVVFRGDLIFSIVMAFVGFFLPRIYVSRVISKRLIDFETQLPDTLGLWVNALRSGYSVMQSMEAVAKDAPEPTRTEFRRVVQEVQLGIDMSDALAHLLERVESADLEATEIEGDLAGTSCLLRWGKEARRIHIPLVGTFNVENTLAALLTVATLLDQDPLDLADHVTSLRSLPGRMSRITAEGAPFNLIVDYAHTPGSFERVLPMIKERTEGRLILLFGSAGERDLKKRPIQGSLAATYAEVVILTDEDPRLEDSMEILEQIARGVREQWDSTGAKGVLELIPDRTEAIETAIKRAKKGDSILCLGKGHESSILYADGPRPWDEEAVARELLTKHGYEVRR